MSEGTDKRQGRTGLVMEGGAMRGLFTAGVTDVLMENGITFDGAIGVSAGAVFGCNFKSCQPGRAVRYNLRFHDEPRFCSFRSWLKTGDLFEAQFCYHDIPDTLDPFDREAYRTNPMPFYVVCTDLETGMPFYKEAGSGDGEDMKWFQASASMPLFSRVVEIDGRSYLDGGMTDPIPLRQFEKMGYDRNVVILTQPGGYRKKPTAMLPLMHAALRKWPEAYRAMRIRHLVYNSELEYIDKRENKGSAFVIRPEKPLGIGHAERDPLKLEEVYEAGRAVMNSRLDALRSWREKWNRTSST